MELEQLLAIANRPCDQQWLAGLIEKKKKDKQQKMWLNIGLFEERLKAAQRQQEQFPTTA
jgi:hypothetical protein